MLRYVFAFAIALTSLGLIAYAADEQKTIKGTITCAKCDLGITKACATVVKEGDKVYYFDKDSNKKNHGKICKSPAEGTVTGTVSKEGDKMVIKATKVEFSK